MNIDDLDWWVLDGTPLAVDTNRLGEMIVSYQTARSELFDARHGLQECYMYDSSTYCYTPSSRATLAAHLATMSKEEIDALDARLESMIRRVELTRDIYAEAENTAEAAARGSAFAKVFSGPASPLPLSAPVAIARLWSLFNDWEEIGAVEMQERLRNFARDHGLLVNPTRTVVDADGTHAYGDIPATRYMASSLLDLLGYDHFYGNIAMHMIGAGGAKQVVVTTRGGEVTYDPGPIGVAGVPTAPITSMADINDRMVAMTEEARNAQLGTFEVVRHEDAAGNVAWNVIIPGTQTWDFPPGNNPQDLITNIQLVANERNDLTDGIRLALDQLPIAPGDAVVFVGHSQGGDAAVDAAADPETGGRLNTVGVVTYGAPTGVSEAPGQSVDVIHLVNAEDFVSGLAGAANTNSENQVTVFLDIEGVRGTPNAHQGEPYAQAYDVLAAEADDSRIQRLQEDIAAGGLWQDGVDAQSYLFQFERTNLDELEAVATQHRGYAAR